MARKLNINLKIEGEALQFAGKGEMFFSSEKYPEIKGHAYTENKLRRRAKADAAIMLKEASDARAICTNEGTVMVLQWDGGWTVRLFGPNGAPAVFYSSEKFDEILKSVRQWANDCFDGIAWECR